MSSMIAQSPYQMESILRSLQHYLEEHIRDMKQIRIRSRCGTCFQKHVDVTLIFEDGSLKVEDWSSNCHTGKQHSHQMTLSPVDYNLFLFHIDQLQKGSLNVGFALKMDYSIGSFLSFSLSPYYPPEDYEIHGQMAYRDRQIKLKQRETEHGIVILLQNFIDFEGLMPKFSETLYIKFKS